MKDYSRLNPEVIVEADEMIGKSDFEEMIKSGGYEAYTTEFLQKFVKDCNDAIKKGESVGITDDEEKSLSKALKDFRSLTRVTVLDENGAKVPVYMRRKHVEEPKQ